MPRRAEHLRRLDQLEAPDLWPRILHREPRAEPQGPSAARRAAVAVFALAVGLAGVGFGIRALVTGSDLALRPPEPAIPSEADLIALTALDSIRAAFPDRSELVLVDPTTGAATPVTDAASRGWIVRTADWSADGRRLVFVMGDPDQALSFAGTWDLFLVNADGSDLRRVTSGANVGEVAWSPNDDRIAATIDQGERLVILNTDGSVTSTVAGLGGGPYGSPSWSPDGTRLAFQAPQVPDSESVDVFMIDLTTGHRSRLTGDGSSSPAWSPDGSTIAFARGDGLWMEGVHPVCCPVRLTTCRLPCTSDSQPTWSPDGTRVAFTRDLDGGAHRQVFLVNADGTGLRQLTSGELDHAFPTWRPDAEATPIPPQLPDPRVKEIDVGFGRSVAVGDGCIWVAVDDDGANNGGYLLCVAPGSMDELRRFPVAAVPSTVEGGPGLAVGRGAVWVGGTKWSPERGSGAAVVTRVDEGTGRTIEIPLSLGALQQGEAEGVADLAVIDDRVWVYVYRGADEPAELVALDAETGSVMLRRPLDTTFQLARIAGGFGSVWVTIEHGIQRGGEVLRVDPSTGEVVARIPWEGSVAPIVATRTGMWVANGEVALGQIDPSTNRVDPIRSDLLTFIPFLVHDADTGLTWYRASTENGSVIAYLRLSDRDGGPQTGTFPTDDPPIALAVSPGSVYLWILTYDGRLVRDTVT